jgi:hypothetical protein
MKIEIWSYSKGYDHGELRCTWTLTSDGLVACDDSYEYAMMEKFGAVSGGKELFPKDGEVFLHALRVQMSGSYTGVKVFE